MRFYEPELFVLLIGVLAIGIFLFWGIARKKKLLSRFGDIPLLLKNAPYISFGRQRSKALLLVLALTLLVITLTRLQFGTHFETVKREGLDIIVALDVSNSMLAADYKPSRMERAKQEIRAIIERLKGDRIGLIAFAGEGFMQCPLTLDYAAAEMLLSVMDEESVSIQGTSLSAAMETALKAFNQQETKHKVLLLLTDGEDHEGGLDDIAEESRKQGVRIYTVGLGSPAGVPIPVTNRQGETVGFRKDEEGEVVISKLNEEPLRQIAMSTGGKYYHAPTGSFDLDRVFTEIEGLEKKEQEGTLVTKYDDRYQWPLLLAMLLLVGEYFLPERKKVKVKE